MIADDHAMFRSGFRAVLDARPDMECVADVGDGYSAIEAVRSLGADLAVLDVRMPKLDGLSAARQLMASGRKPLKVLLLTTFGTDDYLRTALAYGVSGFVLKSLPPPRRTRDRDPRRRPGRHLPRPVDHQPTRPTTG
ncbi:response regulator [Streptomyces sp. NBC_00663]|uniref:response regulator n=1 Tax=Streptomyces sp. NBC_00663 TaxID=2975801 RepID=UPI002E36F3E3|nr:response regulator transcription factor [Streptomyces sp. NBC_00663]